MIEAFALSHSYGTTRALENVSLRVPSGAVVGLVGPNGAGKTTFLRATATLLRPSSGCVRVDGYDTLTAPESVRAILGYLVERATPYHDLLVWEHLDLFARIARHDGAERARRIDAALDRAGLTDRRGSLVRELSKGLRQRLALRATLMHDPKVLLLDEPTDGLDPGSREQVLADVRAHADRGCTALLSSHVLAEVEEVADDVVILVAGRIHASAPEPDRARHFVLRVRGDIEAARDLLAAREEVDAARVDGEWLRVELGAGVEDAAELASALVHGGFALVELREARASLRDRFREAVANERRSGNATSEQEAVS